MTSKALPRRLLQAAATAVATLAVASALAVALAPVDGYRARLIRFVDPVREARTVTVEDVQQRAADFEIDFFGLQYRGNTANLIDAHAYYFGAYEKPELFLLRDSLNVLGPEAVVLDVGANTGLHAMFVSRYAKEVHAFEPYRPVLARLRHAIESNNLPNIVVHPVGLGEAEASLPFFAPPDDNLGTGSFVDGFRTGNRDDTEALRIVVGDDYLPQAGVDRVDLIKMDIEGYEKPALSGLRRVLTQDRPIVLLEVSMDPALPGLFSSVEELRSHLPEAYELFVFAERDLRSGMYRLEPARLSFNRRGRANVVAVPAEKADALTGPRLD